MKRLIKPIPVNGTGVDVDLTGYEPIVYHPLFIRLSRVEQVPLATDVYEGCTHKRIEHAIGTMEFAREIAASAHDIGGNSLKDVQKDFEVAALLHDVGHGPCSHVVENVTRPRLDHKRKTIEIVHRMEKEIKQCGADPDIVVGILEGMHFLSPVLSSVLGAEKFDYISRDLYHCGLGNVPALERIKTCIVLEESGKRRYGIDYSNGGGDEVTNFLKAWWDAHRKIYLHRGVEIPRTMFQRVVAYEFDPEHYGELFNMDDIQLMGRILDSKNKNTKRLAGKLRSRRYHRAVAVLKLDRYENHVDDEDGTVVLGVTAREAGTFKPDSYVREREKQLTNHFGFPVGSIIITNSQDIGRLDPDVKLNERGKESRIFMGGEYKPVSEVFPDFVNYLREEQRRHFSIRILVEDDYTGQFKRKTQGTNLKNLLL
jgi:HD superfamily phosphohydrolase